MFRYMAFAWDLNDLAQTQIVENLSEKLRGHWSCSINQIGLRVYHTGSPSGMNSAVYAHKLSGDSGVVLGTLFRNTTDVNEPDRSVGPSFNPDESKGIVGSNGRDLVSKYWGNYVAIMRVINRESVSILRGPLSSLPCFWLTHRQVTVCFSFLDDCSVLGIDRFTINWEYIANQLTMPVDGEQTGLHEISELQPGECIDFGVTGKRKHVYWNPFEIANTDFVENADEAGVLLRRTIRKCVHTWALHHPNLLHRLSGGLDSSIVLACLNDVPSRTQITCVTEYSPDFDTDEREYAKLALGTFQNFVHIERQLDADIDLQLTLNASRSAIPNSSIGSIVKLQPSAVLARELGATAVFSGGGGDLLFYRCKAQLTVADFLQRRGLARGIGRLTYSAAQLEGLSIWKIIAQALANRFGNSETQIRDEILQSKMFLTDWTKNVGNKISPQAAFRHVPPGKRLQASGLCYQNNYYDSMGRQGDPERITPLFSQPAVELVLRIPTYVLALEGRDRGLARHAFTSDLPPAIVARQSKGGMSEYLQTILRRNLSFARALLLDGLLVQKGVLDRKKLQEALSGNPSSAMHGDVEIYEALGFEAWARNWSLEPQNVAA